MRPLICNSLRSDICVSLTSYFNYPISLSKLGSSQSKTPVSRAPFRGALVPVGRLNVIIARSSLRSLPSGSLVRSPSAVLLGSPSSPPWSAAPPSPSRGLARSGVPPSRLGRAVALWRCIFSAVSATPSAFTSAGGGWVQTRLGDRSGHEPCPCRARTIPAPLALNADLMLIKSY